MAPEWTPMRWPVAWKDPSALSLLKGTAVNFLLIEKGDEFGPVRARAQQEGFQVAEPAALPKGVTMVTGVWAGVTMFRGGGGASAGPTGVPWVDSNGWKVRLTAAMNPESAVWLDAPPKENSATAESYLITIADSAAYGGRWVITLTDGLAAGIAAEKAPSLNIWKRAMDAAGFFAAHKNWADYTPQAVVGVVSDFSGDHEYASQELLNLLARAGQHFRIILKDRAAASSFQGLRAVLYVDEAPPAPALRKQMLAYVEAGGMLITVPKWGDTPGTPAKVDEHPRFSSRILGKGKVAVSKTGPDDPYLLANDSVVLVSHRYDLVRFWNGGATGSYCTLSPDRKQAVVHLLFYAFRGPDSASVRVAGRYRAVKASTIDAPLVPNVEMLSQKDAVEVHLPQVSQYVALEFES